MALTKVDAGLQYFPQFAVDRSIASAEIYVGIPGLDPSVLANQYQAYIVQEDGTQVAVSQPIRTGPGGVPAYNGSPAQIGVNEASYSLKVLNSLGAQIYYIPDSADMPKTSSDAASISWEPPQPVFNIPNRTVKEGLDSGVYNIKWDSRFKQDKVTDNTVFIAEAIANAYAENCALYIPSAPPGFYACVEGGILIQNKQDFILKGDGTQSLFLNVSTVGENLITIDASTHVHISGLGLTGVTGSGNGMEFINASHLFTVRDVWAGWNDGDGFVVTWAISGKFWNCSVDENNGYGPAGLSDAARGDTKRAWYVKSRADGQNNDTNCINCTINGAGDGGNYALHVGDVGFQPVSSFTWNGGLIQASQRAVKLCTVDGAITETHIEPPVGVNPNYAAIMENCVNTVISGRLLQGDVLIKNSTRSGLKNIRATGVNIEPDCASCFLDTVEYGGLNTGPIQGNIIDQSMSSIITNCHDASNSNFVIGNNLNIISSKYLSNAGNQYVINGGVVQVPCGFELTPGTTLTSVGGLAPYFGNAIRVNHSTDLTQGFKIRLAPIPQFRGKKVLVDAILLNQLVAGGGYVLLETTGGATPGTQGQESFLINAVERKQITFNIPIDANTADIIFTGITGAQVNWLSINIEAEGFTPVTEEDATGAATATPDVSFNDQSGRGGYPLKVAIVGAGSNITGFLNPHTGVPFTIRFTAGRTVVNSATLKLAGAANFVASADDLLTLEYGSDGVFREVSRSVN